MPTHTILLQVDHTPGALQGLPGCRARSYPALRQPPAPKANSSDEFQLLSRNVLTLTYSACIDEFLGSSFPILSMGTRQGSALTIPGLT